MCLLLVNWSVSIHSPYTTQILNRPALLIIGALETKSGVTLVLLVVMNKNMEYELWTNGRKDITDSRDAIASKQQAKNGLQLQSFENSNHGQSRTIRDVQRLSRTIKDC